MQLYEMLSIDITDDSDENDGVVRCVYWCLLDMGGDEEREASACQTEKLTNANDLYTTILTWLPHYVLPAHCFSLFSLFQGVTISLKATLLLTILHDVSCGMFLNSSLISSTIKFYNDLGASLFDCWTKSLISGCVLAATTKFRGMKISRLGSKALVYAFLTLM